MNRDEHQAGVLYAAFSYILWGLLPIYWKLLHHVNADEILANRVFWSFFVVAVVLVFNKKWNLFTETLRGLSKNKKQFAALTVASLLISINWFIYIWAVNTDQMIEASLGYYINPLVSVLLGMIFLKERLSVMQYVSFAMAAVGVLIMTVSYGQFPWIALTLAVSFGLYGLAKKLIKVNSAVGLALETLVVMPLAGIYIGYLFNQGTDSLFAGSWTTSLLLAGAGAATAVPLLFFAKGAQRIPLATLGILQYIAPTLTLILGIFVYHETFSTIHLLAFTFIWSALILYSLSRTRMAAALSVKWKKEKEMNM
ncbi:EamA family transporter RarD [Mesobacillus subterraneus]|uniref:EamA family transporter RarD n=1 Tax=Mesobacillus subterraneus TaxID=285983 RepID=UPI00203E3DAB|nr:EamA family transporter RarD [Mesobacillus subterraneus]MCM3666040.1 EamA family transporter RarD [Mesobacillus subterraneus]MCM3684923.1 EamA family transporter RarD [Mesobacillus subterraneus]